MAYSEAQKKATLKYRKENKEQVTIDVNKGTKDKYKAQAQKKGLSLAGYIQSLIEQDIKNDKEEENN